MLKAAWPAVLFSCLVLASPLAFSHSGGVDKKGCHLDTQSGKRHCHPERAAKLKMAPCDMEAPKPGSENVFYGPVVSVQDGDTFKAKIQGVVMKFRLSDMDAPELDQPYGEQAREQLNKLLSGKKVVMLFVDTDRLGRTIAHVWADGSYVNADMVQAGAAWFYPQFADSQCLSYVERLPREARRGLWKLPRDQRVEPWNWRKNKAETG